jgi:hypothetical protein
VAGKRPNRPPLHRIVVGDSGFHNWILLILHLLDLIGILREVRVFWFTGVSFPVELWSQLWLESMRFNVLFSEHCIFL